MDLTNAFCDTIPHNWSHILASPAPRETYYASTSSARRQPQLPGIGHDAQVSSSTRRQEPGNLNNPRYQSCTGNLLVNNPGHVESVRKHNKYCIKAIKPIPIFKTSTGEYIKIYYGNVCRGLRCLSPNTCTNMHLDARDKLRSASR